MHRNVAARALLDIATLTGTEALFRHWEVRQDVAAGAGLAGVCGVQEGSSGVLM